MRGMESVVQLSTIIHSNQANWITLLVAVWCSQPLAVWTHPNRRVDVRSRVAWTFPPHQEELVSQGWRPATLTTRWQSASAAIMLGIVIVSMGVSIVHTHRDAASFLVPILAIAQGIRIVSWMHTSESEATIDSCTTMAMRSTAVVPAICLACVATLALS